MSRENITRYGIKQFKWKSCRQIQQPPTAGTLIYLFLSTAMRQIRKHMAVRHIIAQAVHQGKVLAECVQPHMAAETERYNRGVKSANFAVIKHTNMPAILVETAFIDNYDDNRFLASDDGKYKCAVGIYKGICDYLGIEYKLESEDKLVSREYEELNERLEKVENPMIYDYVDENMPEWARPTITKLVDKGFLKGDEEGKLGLTEDLIRMFIVNDRAGVYGE